MHLIAAPRRSIYRTAAAFSVVMLPGAETRSRQLHDVTASGNQLPAAASGSIQQHRSNASSPELAPGPGSFCE